MRRAMVSAWYSHAIPVILGMLVLLLSAPGHSQAVTDNLESSSSAWKNTVLFTPPLFPLGDQQLMCEIVNVSNRNRIVRVAAFGSGGNLIEETDDITLASGETTSISVIDMRDDNPRYCRFTVQGLTRHFRASVLVFGTSGPENPGVQAALSATAR